MSKARKFVSWMNIIDWWTVITAMKQPMAYTTVLNLIQVNYTGEVCYIATLAITTGTRVRFKI